MGMTQTHYRQYKEATSTLDSIAESVTEKSSYLPENEGDLDAVIEEIKFEEHVEEMAAFGRSQIAWAKDLPHRR